MTVDIKAIVSFFGNVTATARELEVSRQTVHNWLAGRRRIGRLRAQDIAIRMAKHPRGSAA